VVVVVIVVTLVTIALGAILYFMVSGMLTDGPSSHPIVTFGSPSNITNGFMFTVAGASSRLASANYRVNLQVNSTTGTAVPLALNMSVTLPAPVSARYVIAWLDPGGERTLDAGDSFQVTRSGGLQGSTFFTFYLLWIDGTTIQQSSYRTP